MENIQWITLHRLNIMAPFSDNYTTHTERIIYQVGIEQTSTTKTSTCQSSVVSMKTDV